MNIIICCLNILLIFDSICFISIIIIFIKHKKTVVIFLIVLFLLDCCQGDDGDVGPRGLPGEPVGVSVSQTLHTDMTVYMILYNMDLLSSLKYLRICVYFDFIVCSLINLFLIL